jgi:hypothetical protein
MSSLGAKFYPKLKNIFLYYMALVKVKIGNHHCTDLDRP